MTNLKDAVHIAWNEQGKKLAPIYNEGMKGYVERVPGIERAFLAMGAKRKLSCIDEGTPGWGLHVAGSGVLDSLNKTLRRIEAARIDEITCHVSCGAGALAAVRRGEDPSVGDQIALEYSLALSKKTGLPHRVVNKGEMKRPDFHHARVVYYSGRLSFDPTEVPQLPAGFTISRKASLGLALRDVDIAVKNIAFNPHHSYGTEKFTPSEPLLLIAVGNSDEPDFCEERLSEELRGYVGRNEAIFGGKVKVDGFQIDL